MCTCINFRIFNYRIYISSDEIRQPQLLEKLKASFLFEQEEIRKLLESHLEQLRYVHLPVYMCMYPPSVIIITSTCTCTHILCALPNLFCVIFTVNVFL